MLLSVKYNFLFIHIAKTGGTSVRDALQPLRWRDPWYYVMGLGHRVSKLAKHRIGMKLPRHAKAVLAKEILPLEFFEGLFKFSFVRNPWDLQVSSYHHIRRSWPHLLDGRSSFPEFLRWRLDPDRPLEPRVEVSNTPQTDYLIDLHGKVIVDFIGRYESLHQDFDAVCQRIGVPTPRLLHKRRSTQRDQDYRTYFSDETAELVAAHFAQDIRILGYGFDGIARPLMVGREGEGVSRAGVTGSDEPPIQNAHRGPGFPFSEQATALPSLKRPSFKEKSHRDTGS